MKLIYRGLRCFLVIILIPLFLFCYCGFFFPEFARTTSFRCFCLRVASVSVCFIWLSFISRAISRFWSRRSSSDRATRNLVRSLWLLLTVLLLYLMGSTYTQDIDAGVAHPSAKVETAVANLAPTPDSNMSKEESFADSLERFLTSVSKAWQWVSLRYSLDEVSRLMQVCAWYRWVVYAACCAIIFNTVSVTYALLGKAVFAAYTRIAWRSPFPKKRYMIIGNNKDNLSLYASIKCKARFGVNTVISDVIKKEDQNLLYEQGIRYLNQSQSSIGENHPQNASHGEYGSVQDLKQFLNSSSRKGKRVVIINTGDDIRNIALCREVIEYVKQYTASHTSKRAAKKQPHPSEDRMKQLFSNLEVYAFGNIQHEAVFNQISIESRGVVRYVNKYRQTAVDFVKRYPLPLFMDEKQLDYSTGLVKDGVDINVCMIGFGDINQQLLNTLVSTNQFVQKGLGNIPRLKKVKYHIFDHAEARKNKNLNHSYYRYMNEFYQEDAIRKFIRNFGKYPEDYYLSGYLEDNVRARAHEYRPFPHFPAEEYYHKLDINDPEFYHQLRDIGKKNPLDVNYFVIAFGSDMENLDMAQKIREKMIEWNIPNLRIFIRTREKVDLCDTLRKPQNASYDSDEMKAYLDVNTKDICFTFGCEADTVFSLEALRDANWYKATLLCHCMHECEEHARKPDGILKSAAETIPADEDKWNQSYIQWHTQKGTIGRDSYLLGSLGIRPKMLMIGFDIEELKKTNCDQNTRTAIENEYRKSLCTPPQKNTDTPKECRLLMIIKQIPLCLSKLRVHVIRILTLGYRKPDSPDSAEKATAKCAQKITVDFGGRTYVKPLQDDYASDMFTKVKGTARDNLAIQEHFRWCGFQISRGMVPATIEEARRNDGEPFGRNHILRHHGCLTTIEGLNDMVQAGVTDKEKKNNHHAICSNYWAMDDALWFLSLLEMGIVRKHDPNAAAGNPAQTNTTNP